MNQYLKQAIEQGYIESIRYNSFSDIEEIKRESKSEVSKANWNDTGKIVALKSFDIYAVGNDCSSFDDFISK
ncbi:18083_t:CDS:1, partial [Racocetra fulgida]